LETESERKMTALRPGRRRGGAAQGLLTILFTDLEGSTALTQRLGDARAQEVVRAHNTIVRREVRERGGTEIKHTGDGIMATFPSATRAVSAAVAMQQATRVYNDNHPETAFNMGVGLNAGEPVAEDADVFGTAVQLAARTCAQATGGQVLATDVVRQLVFGKGFLFGDTGSFDLKGFDEPVHLFEISGAPGALDEQEEQHGRLSGRWLIAGASAIAVIAAVVAALILALSGGGRTADAPKYRELRSHSRIEGPINIVIGDCVSSDLHIDTPLTGTWTGDIAGAYTGDAKVVSYLEEGCRALQVRGEEAVADATGNRVAGRSFTVVTARIGATGGRGPIVPASAYELRTTGVITGGAGRYQDAHGIYTCDYIGAIQPDLHASQDGDCRVRLSVESPASMIIAAAADRDAVGVSLNASGESDTVRIYGIYHNTTGATIDGARLRLVVPDGAGLAVERPDPAASLPARDGLGWNIPPLPAGEVAYFGVTVRLRSSKADELKVTVRIDANGIDHAIESEPITLRVVR
jgi:class 3 adenylate cyclase